jgi:hypothetical protein
MSFLLTHLGGGSTNNMAGSPSVPGLIINPAASSRGQVWALYAVLAALFDVVLFIILYWQLRRADKKRGIKRHLWPYLRRGPMLAISGGLLAGELLTILILWLTHTTVWARHGPGDGDQSAIFSLRQAGPIPTLHR